MPVYIDLSTDHEDSRATLFCAPQRWRSASVRFFGDAVVLQMQGVHRVRSHAQASQPLLCVFLLSACIAARAVSADAAIQGGGPFVDLALNKPTDRSSSRTVKNFVVAQAVTGVKSTPWKASASVTTHPVTAPRAMYRPTSPRPRTMAIPPS